MNHQRFASYYNKTDNESKKKERLIFNIVMIVISMILIGMVIFSVVLHIEGPKNDTRNEKSLSSICTKTQEPEACFHLLRHVGEKGKVLNYVKAGINATLSELLLVIKPKPRLERSLTVLQRESYEDCLVLLSLGKEELESLYVMANSSDDLGKLNKDDMMNCLSAIISYQHTCSDELMRIKSYEVLGYSLKVPILLTRIILAIVENFSQKPHNISTNAQQDGFPRWFPVRDSQIVESQGEVYHHWPMNAVVAQDGSGHFSTISESLKACPTNNTDACFIYVRSGKYEERVVIPKDIKEVFMFGDGPTKTIVSGINTRDSKTVTTFFRAATFVVMGKRFICKDMGFSAPTYITGAPALLVISDHAAFFNCKIDGEEGTLYALAQRQFYRNCEILGSVDIIKGDSATVIQNSRIIIKPRNSPDLVFKRNVVSAQYRIDRYQTTGLVIQNCTIMAQEQSISSLNAKSYLGAPYSDYSRTIIMESFLGHVLHPKGWCKWSDNYGIETVTFREFNNTGPGARTDGRVKWNGYSQSFERDQMVNFTAGRFIQADQWLLNTGIPYEHGFTV